MRISLRDQFLLRPDVVFLNHGSFGARPRAVVEAYHGWQRELEGQPVEFLGRRFGELMRWAREVLADYVHACAADLVFVPNATTGLNVVARSLPLEPGDEVVTSDHEYGALDRTWRFVWGKRGARYINQRVPLPVQSAEQVVEAVWAGVTPRTRVLFLSHITSPTSLIFPVQELVRRARDAGLWTVVDGAHAPGQITLDLEALGADFYAGNCHKWLCSPPGSAFLYARREVQHLIEPLVISWGWEPEPTTLLSLDGTVSRFVLENEWQGTRDPAAYLSVPAAIQFQAEHDWPRVRAECHELLREARRRIEALTGLPGICPDSPEWYAQMAALPLPPCDAGALQRRLYDEYRVEVPVIEWNGRQLVRVSVQGYNTADDVGALVRALADLLPSVS
ncbi:MAG TPA: aminotransferase class V-fold PLP-dependent enzyme [Anaerolineae bacterium]|nr:aminotransferase class V-fold PLP-dependent enzyme [Anaerolineae bacterium]